MFSRIFLTFLVLTSLNYVPADLNAQTAGQPYESKITQRNNTQLEYMDFGGNGPALFIVMDFHNYFEMQNEEGWEEVSRQYIDWMAGLSENYRVIANVRRGWGGSKTDNPSFHVYLHSADMLHIMDTENIKEAFFYGRTSATSEMIWLAEHHPDRVAGLIMTWIPMVPYPKKLQYAPEVQEFATMDLYNSCDTQEKDLSREEWTPHFMTGEKFRSDVPILLFYSPEISRDRILRKLERLDNDPENWSGKNACGNEEGQAYFNRLAADEQARKKLLELARPTEFRYTFILERLEKSFGNLIIVNEDEELTFADDNSDYFETYMPKVNEFISKINTQ